MTESVCRICDEHFRAEASETSGPADICPACREKLSAPLLGESKADQTTVLRPRSVLGGAPRVASSLVASGDTWTEGENRDVLSAPPRSDSAKARTAQPPTVGKLFGNYEILEEVNRGSFGVVYRARQQGLDRVVALKVLLAGAHASPEAIARFQREARAVAKLKHPCIVPIYDIGMQDGHHYFAMEFIEGDALGQRISARAIPISGALLVAERLADAVHSAHEQGVIHRDIKPSNILLDREGAPHLTDFGLAKQIDMDTQYTQSGTTLGTPAYMPPEQARGEVQKIDARSDVYALGAVLYEMLTGRPPFAGRSLLEVVIAVINEPVRPPRQVNPKIHRDIQTMVLKCLEKDPRNRYLSAAELRDDIRRFRSGEAIRARPVGLGRKAARFLYKHSFFLGAVATVLLAVTLSIKQVQKVREQAAKDERKREQESEWERRERERKEVELSRPEWKPFWWTPDRPEDLLSDEERELFREGFVHPPPAAIAYVLVDGKPRAVTANLHLYSPPSQLIIGDLDATIRFHLDEQASTQGVHIGIHNWDSLIPYILEIRPGRLTVVGPRDMTGTANLPKRAAELVVKAEGPGPALAAGEYTLRIRREGLDLSFELAVPGAEKPSSMRIWDLGLSNWKFKNTQLTIRDVPQGFRVLSADVLCKVSSERPKKIDVALGYFNNGEYNTAEFTFRDIVSNEANRQDEVGWLRLAEASLHLGLIKDLNLAAGRHAMGLDGPAPEAADNVHYLHALDALSKCPPSEEKRRLLVLTLVRRIHNATAAKRWLLFDEEAAHLEPLLKNLPKGRSGLGEPYCWAIQPALRSLVSYREAESMERALTLFRFLGIPGGCGPLDDAAADLGQWLAQQPARGASLYALHQAYPAPSLLPAFLSLMKLRFEAGEYEAGLKALEYAAAHLGGGKNAPVLEKAAAQAFAKLLGIQRFAVAQEVLRLCPKPALVADTKRIFAQVAKDLTQEADLEPAASVICSIRQVAEKLPDGPPPLAEAVASSLTHQKRYELALRFVAYARVEGSGEAPRLMALAANALDRIKPAEDGERLLAEIQTTLELALQQRAAEWRQVRIELGDLYLSAGAPEKALEWYRAGFEDAEAEPDLVARAGLRLGALWSAQQNPGAFEVWVSLTRGTGFQEEARLLGRYLSGMVPQDELPSLLARAGGPLAFSEAEWTLARALRLRAEGDATAAALAIKETSAKAAETREWPYALARILVNLPAEPQPPGDGSGSK